MLIPRLAVLARDDTVVLVELKVGAGGSGRCAV